MKLNVLLSGIGLFVGVVGAFFLTKGIWGVSPSQIAKQTTPKWGFNSELIKSVSFQRADSLVGFILVLIGFVLQFSAIVVGERIITQNTTYTILLIVVVGIICTYILSLRIGENTRIECLRNVFQKNDYLEKESDEWIVKKGKELFGLPKRNDETFEEYKKRLSEFINK